MTGSRKIWRRFALFPPVLCRLLARHPRWRALRTEEIAERSGLNHWDVARYSEFMGWDSMRLPDVVAFLRGCDTDFTDPVTWKRLRTYVSRNPSFPYLRRSPDWDDYYKPLIRRYHEYLERHSGPDS